MGREMRHEQVEPPPKKEVIVCDITDDIISVEDIAVESDIDNIIISKEFYSLLPRSIFEEGDVFPKTKFLIDSYYVSGLCRACAGLLEDRRPIPDMNSGMWLLTIEENGGAYIQKFDFKSDLEKYVQENLFSDDDRRNIFGMEVFIEGVPQKASLYIGVSYGG